MSSRALRLISASHKAGLAAAILLAALGSPTAYSQGCTQCRDNTATTPPATQRAYRHAIELLAATATTLFATTVYIIRRQP